MKKRSKAAREPIKGQRRKTAKPERRNGRKAVHARSSTAGKETKVARLTRERDEALEHQTATSEVLQVISGSAGDPHPVFEAILAKAVRICDAHFGNIHRWDGNAFYLVATHNTPPALAEARRRSPLLASPQTAPGRLVATKTAVHITDLAADSNYVQARDPTYVTGVELGGIRTLLIVPMLKENELIGSFAVYRQEVRPFADKQIALVTNFAAQAVIAIENARLLNELRQRTTDLTERTADLTEALEQQTATSEVLSVISSSLGELEAVFQSMLENAVRICQAKFGFMLRYDGEAYHTMATLCPVAAYADEMRRGPLRPDPASALGIVATTRQVAQIPDITAHRLYKQRDPVLVAGAELGGIRTIVAVPMLKDNQLIGAITIFRQEVRPFTDKQIELVKNFAAQAVIAIENARLLSELRQRTDDLGQRTRDLTEALEQQTATSEVLQVISGSPGDLQPVFAAMLENATRICDAKFGNLYRWDDGVFHLVATHNTPRPFAEARLRSPPRPTSKNLFGRIVAAKKVIHISDFFAEGQEHFEPGNPDQTVAVTLGGVQTILVVPLLKENELLGFFSLMRQEVKPFTDKQIELVTNFAAQAVIAIENARLLTELRERTEQVEAQSQQLVKLNQQLEQRVAYQVGEIERMGRLRRFLPPQVADLIVASGTEKQLESHRREITALFCDLRGFTGFTESADAEDVMALLRDYHATVGEKIIRYSGTLERYAGDGVMVVFNDPVPVENPALQAVLMALEMREAIGALTETWRRWGHEIGFGIGIAHGFATLGTIGFEGRFDYAAIGTVSNVASRLCDEAKPGQILISPRVLTKVEDAVQVEPVGEFELKGIRRPLAAYNVVAAGSSKPNANTGDAAD